MGANDPMDETLPDLDSITSGFARGIEAADSRHPQAKSARSERLYLPGIGPHTESQTIQLVMAELSMDHTQGFRNFQVQLPYPNFPRRKCDLAVHAPKRSWYLEVKMARFKGDNGKPSDEALMHLISPYEADRSALTDCQKLAASGFPGSLAILIYGFDFEDKQLDPAIEAFEILARARFRLGDRSTAAFSGLIHPVHQVGRVFAWRVHSEATLAP
jgi:hypothetical protein